MKNHLNINQNMLSGQHMSIVFGYASACFIVVEAFIKEKSTFSIEFITIIFMISLFLNFLASYLKILNVAAFKFEILKSAANVNIIECLINIKKIAFLEEALKINFINITILTITAFNHYFFYPNKYVNSFLMGFALCIQTFCFLMRLVLEDRQIRYLTGITAND
ncbi:hypothetical protein [Colwellia sp. Arc7-D]|uniref:hypothetical protein n=1 Tax=Colwellia sp. Arc7-D TaxID=2161872 RepID=UPI000D3D9D8B|nr:hypothetical protein [Colwellia sp. Arc7-D]AWB56227.1 hypothetical protein DBO93_00685 [Colwellia sp. Arc7-D]